MHPRKIFFSTALAGLVGGALPFFFLGNNPAAATICTTVVVLSSLGFYHKWAWRLMLKRPEALSVADSCYYLGFIYTLGILCISFLFAAKHGSIEIKDITTQFALGLITTGYGLIARIHLSNFNDIETIDDALMQQERIAAKLLEMSRKIEYGTTQLQLLFEAQSKHLEETVIGSRKGITEETASIAKLAADFSQRITDLSKSFIPDEEAAALKKAIGAFAKTMDEGRADAEKWTTSLSTTAQEFGKHSATAASGLDAVKASASAVSSAAGNCVQQITQLSTQFEHLARSTDSAKTRVDATTLDKMQESVASFSMAAAAAIERVKGVEAALVRLATGAQELEAAQKAAAAKIKDAADRFASTGS